MHRSCDVCTHTHARTSFVWTWNWKTFIYRDMQSNVETAAAFCLRIVLRGVLFITIHRAKGSGKGRKRAVYQTSIAFRVQMPLLEIAANSPSLQPQSSTDELLIISLSDMMWRNKRILAMVIKQLIN